MFDLFAWLPNPLDLFDDEEETDGETETKAATTRRESLLDEPTEGRTREPRKESEGSEPRSDGRDKEAASRAEREKVDTEPGKAEQGNSATSE